MARTTKAKETVDAEVNAAGSVPEKIVPKEIDPHQYVTVKNGYQGGLIYISPRTHEEFRWDSFGDEQEIELQELKNAKANAKKFFTNNWFMFDEDWIIDYLGVGQYYKHALTVDDFDKIFEKTPAEIKKICAELSEGQKRSISYRARQLISEGAIDSLKRISVLEDVLGVELVEK